MKFSVITVTFNSGGKLLKTVQSVLNQTYADFEIIVKDGLSTDKSLDTLPRDDRIRVYAEADTGIYDAMNQAAAYATGDYLLFLNCGDLLYAQDVFQKTCRAMAEDRFSAELYYGDAFVSTRGGVVVSPHDLNDYALITRTICHQCLFFSRRIFETLRYNDRDFGLAADMALYVRCLKAEGMHARHLGFIVANYEGGGVSESAETRKQINAAKEKILQQYFSEEERRRLVMQKALRLRYLKEWLSSSRVFLGLYEKLAALVYQVTARRY